MDAGGDSAKESGSVTAEQICQVCKAPIVDGQHECAGEQSDSSTDSDLKPGTIISENYEVISVLGEGGMGVVLKARDMTLNRVVAIKVVHARLLADKGSVKRFRQEAQASGALDHLNIIRILHFGVDDKQRPFLVMDFLEGESLGSLLEEGVKLPLEEAIPILVQVCEGLQHAHQHGVVHRDLKPSNVMLLPSALGRIVKIVDFGIAKVMPNQGYEGMKLTSTGEVLGSPLYMSPEQCLAMELDSRSDIYAMGCLIFATLTGQPPFCNTNVYETYYQHINDMPESISKRLPEIKNAGAIDAVILQCMAKEPQNRYQTMSELANALQQLLVQKKKKGLAHELTGTVKLIALKARAGKVKIPTWSWAVLVVFLLTGAAAASWYCGMWLQPAERQWKTLYLRAQNDMNSGMYAVAQKELDDALMLAKSSRPLMKYALPTLVEMEDLAAINGDEKSRQDLMKKASEAQAASSADQNTQLLKDLDDAIKQAAQKRSAEDLDRYRELSESGLDAAAVCSKSNEIAQAELLVDKTQKLVNAAFSADDRLNGRCFNFRGANLHKQGKLDQAEQMYKQSLDIMQKQHDENRYKVLCGLGLIDEKRHQMDKARLFFNEALRICRDSFGAQAEQMGTVKLFLGELYLNDGKKQRGLEELQQARKIFDISTTVDEAKRARCYALIAFADGKREEIENALAMQQESLTKDDFYLVWLLDQVGDRMQDNKATRALIDPSPLFKRAFVIALRSDLRDQPEVDLLISKVDRWYMMRNELLKLKPLYLLQLEVDKGKFGERSERVALDLNALGQFYRRLGNLTKSEEYYKQALKVREQMGQPLNWATGDVYAGLTQLYVDSKQDKKAQECFAKIMALLDSPADGAKSKPSEVVPGAIYSYCLNLEKKGDKPGAEVYRKKWQNFVKAIALNSK